MTGGWQFDAAVAARFDAEARAHIPNYESIIETCVTVAGSAFPGKSARIIDVGSATGYTLERLLAAGFSDVHGVEASAAMRDRSRHKDRVILSDSFPADRGPFDMVLANWTLHFLPDRAAYLRDIYDALAPGGTLILSEKIDAGEDAHAHYHDFKRRMGVSDEEIARKEASLQGVLIPLPLSWYFETLSDIGFTGIRVIDSLYCFATLVATKKAP